MIGLLVIVAAGVALVAAVRSTWSPCGLSMLSSITPISEQGRGHRFGPTAAWFVLGAALGGASLGTVAAGLAVAVDALSPGRPIVLAAAAAASGLAAFSDSSLPFQLPHHRRQVNEVWLDSYRPWVYGAGFGWQIGVGVATYIITASVYLLVVLAALTASPLIALLLCSVFGLIRGLAVLLTSKVRSPADLAAFHRRFAAIGPRVRDVVVGVLAASALLFLAGATGIPTPPVALVGLVGLVGLVALSLRWRRAWLVTA